MAYKLQTQKILPGGLNLLPPGDQVAEGDCLDLTDWWPGTAGRLEQAPQLVQRNLPTVLTAQNSLLQADGRIYYGGGGNLRQIGRNGEAPIDTGYDSAPLGMISYQGYAWIMNRSKQRKDDGTTVSNWTPAAPAAPTLADQGTVGDGLNPPNDGGLFAQEYTYYTTWQLGTLGETNPSAAATITPAVDLSIVRVTRDASPPANATGWHVYRKSPTFSAPYRLNEFTLDIARTYVDDYGNEVHTHSDTQLLELGIIMESDHDAAPAARVIANQVYNGRILVANSAAHPNRIWYTQALQPGFFRGSANPNDGDWVDIGTDLSDEIRAMAVHQGMVVIYRARSIWVHKGDFGDTNALIEPAVPERGIIGYRAMASTSLGDYFLGNDGVYKFNNDWAPKISLKVEPVFRGQATENLPQYVASASDPGAVGYRNGRLWVSYPTATSSATLVYHVETERWFASSEGYSAFLDTGTELLGAGAGVYALDSSYVAGPTLLAFQSEYQDCGLADHEKTFADLVLNHNTRGQILTITIRTNKNAGLFDSFTLGTIQSSVMTRQVIPLTYPGSYPAGSPEQGTKIRAFNLSVRITGNGASGNPVLIDGPILLHYFAEARQSKTFDTDETDHGTYEVKTVDQVEFDIDATSGPASLQVYSDHPGGAMAAREPGSLPIPQTSGRQIQTIVLPAGVDGTLLRYTVNTPTTMQIYGARVRILPIGVYLDGTIGDYWQPQPLSVGV